ncbi:MAG: PASTA domain-containing protein [Bacteroidetes bacterium]|nr:MAG: PASTA domain-containing protein [Bacteroidota bacterium]
MGFLSKLKSYFWSLSFLKHLGLILLVYGSVVGGLMYYLESATKHGEKIEVPNLIGKNIRSIDALLMGQELSYEVLDSIYAPEFKQGTIISQDPSPTDSTNVYVKSGRTIRLRLSKKSRLVEMPDLIHKSERFAQSVLKNRGFQSSISYKPTTEANGAVMEQLYKGKSIQAGKKIPIGSKIRLVVGKNQVGAPIQIPNLSGLTINDVKNRLSSTSSLNLFTVFQNCQNAADSAQAKVISQSPEYIEGLLSPSNSTITVILSLESDQKAP